MSVLGFKGHKVRQPSVQNDPGRVFHDTSGDKGTTTFEHLSYGARAIGGHFKFGLSSRIV